MRILVAILVSVLLMTTPCSAMNVPAKETAEIEQVISLTHGIFLRASFSNDMRFFYFHVYDTIEGKFTKYAMGSRLSDKLRTDKDVEWRKEMFITYLRQQLLGTIVEFEFINGTQLVKEFKIVERFRVYDDSIDEYGKPMRH